jgi:Zn-dependent M28 family amino/carboxypeptidase
VSFSAEEQSLQGSAAYVEDNYAAGQMPEPRLAINLDELSAGFMKGLVLGFPHLRGLIQQQFDTMGDGLVCHVMPQLDGGSDHFSFFRAGIDAAHVWRWRFHASNPDALFHHEAADTADKINVRELKEHVGCLARLLLRLADVPPDRWPRNDITAADVGRQLERERAGVARSR